MCIYIYIYIYIIHIQIYILYIYTYIYVAGYIATYLANTAVVNIRILSRRYHFRFLVFASIGECISYWLWQVYCPVCYKVNDAKTFKNPVYCFKLANQHVYYRLVCLIGTFNWDLGFWFAKHQQAITKV